MHAEQRQREGNHSTATSIPTRGAQPLGQAVGGCAISVNVHPTAQHTAQHAHSTHYENDSSRPTFDLALIFALRWYGCRER